jgi:hypothetical protein
MQVSGAPYTTLDRWINDGWVTPTNNGEGTGSSRQWNLMQTLAATFGYRCKQAGFGRVIDETIRFIANGLSQKELKRHIERGETLLLVDPKVGPIWLEADENQKNLAFNIGTVYEELIDDVRTILEG